MPLKTPAGARRIPARSGRRLVLSGRRPTPFYGSLTGFASQFAAQVEQALCGKRIARNANAMATSDVTLH